MNLFVYFVILQFILQDLIEKMSSNDSTSPHSETKSSSDLLKALMVIYYSFFFFK